MYIPVTTKPNHTCARQEHEITASLNENSPSANPRETLRTFVRFYPEIAEDVPNRHSFSCRETASAKPCVSGSYLFPEESPFAIAGGSDP